MKNKLMYGIILLTFITLTTNVVADNSTELYVAVTTEQPLNTIIVENSDGNIDNTIYCNGGTCTTNINGGTVNIPENQTFNYNSYTNTYNSRRGNGLSMNGLINSLGSTGNAYYQGNVIYDEGYNLWTMLDFMFVSHREDIVTQNNMEYLARKMDRTEARLNILEKTLHLENDTNYLKQVNDEENIIYALRTNKYTCFEDGMCVIVR
jgi:hypothetical protein